jgi:hypothetical protein
MRTGKKPAIMRHTAAFSHSNRLFALFLLSDVFGLQQFQWARLVFGVFCRAPVVPFIF